MTPQQAGVLVDQLDDIHRVDGAGAGVGLGNTQFLTVLSAGTAQPSKAGGMLQLGGDDVGAGHVGDDGLETSKTMMEAVIEVAMQPPSALNIVEMSLQAWVRRLSR